MYKRATLIDYTGKQAKVVHFLDDFEASSSTKLLRLPE